MKISYSVFCPECKVLGVNKKIFFENGDFLCDEGHKYTSMEDVELRLQNLGVAGVPEEVPAERPHIVNVTSPAVPEDREEDEREVEALKSMTMAPPPSPPTGTVEAVENAVAMRSDGGVTMLYETVESYDPLKDPLKFPEETSRSVAVKMPGVRELPGDALEITVIIPDPHASYLRGEAQFRGKTVQEHFEEIMLNGMDSRWWY
jgi:hypothetical protein